MIICLIIVGIPNELFFPFGFGISTLSYSVGLVIKDCFLRVQRMVFSFHTPLTSLCFPCSSCHRTIVRF
ncbi:hypothetical protein CW304_09440 [Bacillus sp. UFRGS-B20]|nr:hypothetical protein CW304_09440 [Bacillus sp. UFRGS-B20]